MSKPHSPSLSSLAVATTPGHRPLEAGQIIDAGFRLFGRRRRTFIMAALAVAVPLNLASTGLVLALAPDQFDIDAAENPLVRLTESGQGGALAAVAVARLIDLVASAVAFAACLRIAADDLAGRDPGPGPALAYGLRRAPAATALLLVVGVGVGIGIVLLIVPGVFLATIWALALPVLVLERAGVGAALGRSHALVRGRFWPVLGILALAFVLMFFTAALVGAVAGGIAAGAGAGDEASGGVAALASGVASMAVGVPLATGLLFVLYVDQRVRHEGATREALARELGEPGGAPPPEPDSPWQPPPAPEQPEQPELPGGWQPPRPPDTRRDPP